LKTISVARTAKNALRLTRRGTFLPVQRWGSKRGARGRSGSEAHGTGARSGPPVVSGWRQGRRNGSLTHKKTQECRTSRRRKREEEEGFDRTLGFEFGLCRADTHEELF
jgi:hypothetical protein